jgi:hypothetical protein
MLKGEKLKTAVYLLECTHSNLYQQTSRVHPRVIREGNKIMVSKLEKRNLNGCYMKKFLYVKCSKEFTANLVEFLVIK